MLHNERHPSPNLLLEPRVHPTKPEWVCAALAFCACVATVLGPDTRTCAAQPATTVVALIVGAHQPTVRNAVVLMALKRNVDLSVSFEELPLL